MSKTSAKDKKSTNFQIKSADNLETPGGIHKENATMLQKSQLKNCGKLSSLSLKNCWSSYPKRGTGKTDLLSKKKHN